MMAHKLRSTPKRQRIRTVIPLFIISIARTGVTFAAPLADAPPAPQVSELDQAYLLRVVRRAIEAEWTGQPPYEPPYEPESLQSLFCRASVTLRRLGRVEGVGSSLRRPVVQACLKAATEAAKDPRSTEHRTLEWLNKAIIGIELMGELQPVGRDLDDDATLRESVEPGVHGLGVRIGDRELCLTPGDMIAYGHLALTGSVTTKRYPVYPPANWLRLHAPELTESGRVDFRDLTPFRFRTTHFCEPQPLAPPVTLHRGAVLVPPEAVTAETLDEAIDRVGRYLHFRQNSDGLFSYEYLPATDEYVPLKEPFTRIDAQIIRQAAAVWSLVRYARWSGRKEVLDAANLGLKRMQEFVLTYPGRDDIAFLGRFGAQNKLGFTALYTLALVEHPDDEHFVDVRKKFVAGILTLQQPNGIFFDVFPPAEPNRDIESQMYYPGEALLALARWHERAGDASSPVPTVFSLAFPAYREIFRKFPQPPFVPWQSQAFALMSRLTRNDDYAAFVYEMTDWLAEKQLTEADCPWPELRGGVAGYLPDSVGVATAVYLEGFADALALAKHRGDRRYAQRYETVVRDAARFVLQLMVRPEECYYMLSPRDAVGGIRTTLTNHTLRIDHVQHALMALIKTREALFGPRPPGA